MAYFYVAGTAHKHECHTLLTVTCLHISPSQVMLGVGHSP